MFAATAALLIGCATESTVDTPAPSEAASTTAADKPAAIPAATRAWMDRLTVAHEYDPATGFIVAREVVALPPAIATAPPLREAVAIGRETGRPVVVFATADRCAPCQQYKRDAINDDRVIRALASGPAIATHIEVDRDPDAARSILGGPAIPMTYLIRDGEIVASLRGQRSADELLAWLFEHDLWPAIVFSL